jgi:hypothetical protein
VNEDDVVRFVRFYIEGLFPKVCTRCGKRFGSLREYLQLTRHVGNPVLYEVLAAATCDDPLGPISHANCPCGNTLTIGSEGIPAAQMVELLKWARADSIRRSIGVQDLLRHLRDRIDAEVLRDDESSG